MQRLIVTSATYRQSSTVSAGVAGEGSGESPAGARAALPPARRDGARQRAGRQRPARQARSAGRACSRISRRASGKSWRAARRSPRRNTTRATGADLYRRSMYTFWKRTRAAGRADHVRCAGPREMHGAPAVTNTPLQALVLLNDPTYVEAARALAQRAMLRSAAAMPARASRFLSARPRRASRAPRNARARRPGAARARTLHARTPTQARETDRRGRVEARPMWKPLELAAWTTVASTILNLDETITKE